MLKLFRLGVAFSLFVLVSQAEAATLYLDPNTTEINLGDTIAMAVRLDVDEGECVNVVDGTIVIPDVLAAVDISIGESILPFWVEEPTINEVQNTVTFAGGIPNGYCGRVEEDPRLTNVILEIILQAPGDRLPNPDGEQVAIALSPNTQAFLNDGVGTAAPLQLLPSTVLVYGVSGIETINEWQARVSADDIPPNEFSITLESDPSIFGGDYFIVFNTTDKQSGIDHYEVMEEPLDQFNLFRWGAIDAPWIQARSPYQLEDQSLNSTIRVKAIDKAGNEYIAVYVPEESLRSMSNQTKSFILLGGFSVLLVIMLVLSWLAYRRQTRLLDEAIEHPEQFTDHDNHNRPSL